MTSAETRWERLRHWLEPFVYLSNNLISMLGVLTVTASVVLWIFMLPTLMHGETGNPYTGILTFLLLPGTSARLLPARFSAAGLQEREIEAADDFRGCGHGCKYCHRQPAQLQRGVLHG
jgi:hypothetical protein